MREKYSGGPNRRANFARVGARKIRKKMLTVPAMNDPKARDAQGRPGPSVARHPVTVQTGDHRGRLSGDVHEDRRGRSAVHRAVHDPRQQDDGRNGGDMKGDGQKQREGRRRADPGQNADERSHEDPDEAEQKVHRQGRYAETEEKIAEKVHGRFRLLKIREFLWESGLSAGH